MDPLNSFYPTPWTLNPKPKPLKGFAGRPLELESRGEALTIGAGAFGLVGDLGFGGLGLRGLGVQGLGV